jgi:hypothetical protein
MELALLLSLVVMLSGIWIFLYNAILELTLKSPADATLAVLGLVHLTVLCYLCLALYVLYETGRGIRTKHQPSVRSQMAERILLETWPVTLAALACGFAMAKIGSSEFWIKVPFLLLAGSGIFMTLYRSWKAHKTGEASPMEPVHVFWFFVGIGALYVPYMLIAGILLADVQITTDKEFYNSSDTVLFSVQSAGYIFRPELKRVTFGTFQTKVNVDSTFAVTPEQRAKMNLIMVDYTPQAAFWTRTAYHSVKVVKQPD